MYSFLVSVLVGKIQIKLGTKRLHRVSQPKKNWANWANWNWVTWATSLIITNKQLCEVEFRKWTYRPEVPDDEWLICLHLWPNSSQHSSSLHLLLSTYSTGTSAIKKTAWQLLFLTTALLFPPLLWWTGWKKVKLFTGAFPAVNVRIANIQALSCQTPVVK